MTTDYHQKPIADMTPGELRAYRRELARAALPGFCANSAMSSTDIHNMSALCLEQSDDMIEHERREEQGENHG